MNSQNASTGQEIDHNQSSDSLSIGQGDHQQPYPKSQIHLGLTLAILGYLLFLLGARPSLFGLDRSRVIGFVQISVFLIGLGIIIVGSYLVLNSFWIGTKKTIAADIGSRLVSTGYVICVFTGMADIFGLGSHRLPDVFFGPLQGQGMSLGMATIAVGFLLLIRYKRPKNSPPSPEGIMDENVDGVFADQKDPPTNEPVK